MQIHSTNVTARIRRPPRRVGEAGTYTQSMTLCIEPSAGNRPLVQRLHPHASSEHESNEPKTLHRDTTIDDHVTVQGYPALPDAKGRRQGNPDPCRAFRAWPGAGDAMPVGHGGVRVGKAGAARCKRSASWRAAGLPASNRRGGSCAPDGHGLAGSSRFQEACARIGDPGRPGIRQCAALKSRAAMRCRKRVP